MFVEILNALIQKGLRLNTRMYIIVSAEILNALIQKGLRQDQLSGHRRWEKY